MLLAKSVHHIKDHIKEMRKVYDKNIDKQQTKVPLLFNKVVFSNFKQLVTWHVLGKLQFINLLSLTNNIYYRALG